MRAYFESPKLMLSKKLAALHSESKTAVLDWANNGALYNQLVDAAYDSWKNREEIDGLAVI